MHPDLPAYIEANRDATARLSALLDTLADGDFVVAIDQAWTVGAALAHLAYWDRRYTALLSHNRRGEWPPDGHELITDVQNDALLPEWRLLPAAAVRELTRESAARVDEAIAALPDQVVARILERGDVHLVRRSRHRHQHIDQIEAILKR